MKPKFIELAKKIARKSSSEFQLSCIITKKNRVISVGWNNMSKSHPKSKSIGNYLHAEVHSVLGMSHEETKGTTAYVFRIKKDGTQGMAKSCPCCREILKSAGIKTIYYSLGNGVGEEKL